MMKVFTRTRLLGIAALVLSSAGCATPPVFDYGPYLAHEPRSILILPPLDESPEVDATYGCLSTISRPLAEWGFYVFPVAVVDHMMRENGLPTPGEMHQVSLAKLVEVFDPDAVLYLTVHDWGTGYQVIASTTQVSITGVLVDADTGTEIWRGNQTLAHSSSSGGGGLAGLIAGALVNQVASSVSDPSRSLSRQVSQTLVANRHNGLLYGPHHPSYEERLKLAGAESE